jgi:hypothetical protein
MPRTKRTVAQLPIDTPGSPRSTLYERRFANGYPLCLDSHGNTTTGIFDIMAKLSQRPCDRRGRVDNSGFFVIYKIHCPAEIFMAKILWWGLRTTRQNVLIGAHTLAGGLLSLGTG